MELDYNQCKKSATDMSGIITRELTMGIISFALIFVSIAAVLLYFKQQLKDRKKDCRESFVSLRIALDCRHQAVRHVLDAYSKHLQEQGIASDPNVQQIPLHFRIFAPSRRHTSACFP